MTVSLFSSPKETEVRRVCLRALCLVCALERERERERERESEVVVSSERGGRGGREEGDVVLRAMTTTIFIESSD